jgi:drug/metabolite transporter (DMT)-like permease
LLDPQSLTASSNNKLGVAWMIGAATSFTGLYVAARELGQILPTFEILFFRSLFTIALMLPWLLRSQAAAFRTRRPILHLLRGCSTFTAMTMMFYGVAHSPLADASALQSTYPLFTIVLAMMLVGERPGVGRLLAALTGFIGILTIVRPGFGVIGPPTLALLGCSIFYAVSNTVVKLMAGTDHPTQMVFSVNAIVLVLSAIPTVYVWVTPPLHSVPWIGLLALSGYCAHICLTRALSYGEASVVMPFDYLRLPFAALLGFWLYLEVPDFYTVIGGLIIVASVSYIAAAEARPVARSKSVPKSRASARV